MTDDKINKKRREAYAENPEPTIYRTNEYRKANPDINRKATQKYYEKNKHAIRERRKSKPIDADRALGYRLRKFHISVEQYRELLSSQNHCCAICGKHESDNNERSLSIDHDHRCCPKKSTSCGKCIRGLLCIGCNAGIGHLQDSVDTVSKALRYLEKF